MSAIYMQLPFASHINKLYLVSKQASWTNHIVEQLLSNMCVNCTKWVVYEVDVLVLIHRPGQ